MAAKRLTFVTGNKNKLDEVKQILGEQALGEYKILNQSIDLPEFQAATNREITIQKCEDAFRIVQGPVIVDDTGLHFKAMGDLPGPYIKWFLEKLKPTGLYTSLVGFGDFTAEASCTVALKESADQPVRVFEGRTAGLIVPPRGPTTFGWTPCFQPDGFTETFAEMSKETKNRISHRYKAFELLKQYLLHRDSTHSCHSGN